MFMVVVKIADIIFL